MTAVDLPLGRPRETEWTLVVCEDCGRPFHLLPRSVRNLLAGHRSARCARCRYGETLIVTDVERRFWLDAFSMEEIVEMATAAWGPPSSWSGEWRTGFTFTLAGSDEVAA